MCWPASKRKKKDKYENMRERVCVSEWVNESKNKSKIKNVIFKKKWIRVILVEINTEERERERVCKHKLMQSIESQLTYVYLNWNVPSHRFLLVSWTISIIYLLSVDEPLNTQIKETKGNIWENMWVEKKYVYVFDLLVLVFLFFHSRVHAIMNIYNRLQYMLPLSSLGNKKKWVPSLYYYYYYYHDYYSINWIFMENMREKLSSYTVKVVCKKRLIMLAVWRAGFRVEGITKTTTVAAILAATLNNIA
jgi:hypothetical protein